MIVYMSKPYVTFLSLNKKVTKEVSPGEALGANAPSPGNPTRRIYDTFIESILQNLYFIQKIGTFSE